MKKIGLTGVMGAGKSSVIAILKENNIPILDCDKINAELLEKGNAGHLALTQLYGINICDENDNIDKQKMSDFMFSQPHIKKEVENILHPLIKKTIDDKLNLLDTEIAVVEVPLLFEVRWEDAFDEVWVVCCDEEILLERLAKYRGISQSEAKRRLAHQISQQEKRARADVVFENNGDMKQLRLQVLKALGRE